MLRWIEGSTSAELRQKALDHYFTPLADRIFELDEELQSVVWAVAQYWNDEAEDAVHNDVFPSSQFDPKWPDLLQAPRFVEEQWDYPVWNLTKDLPRLDENTTGITAFASYCQEGSHQEMTSSEAYLPYAIARRGVLDQGVEIEIVGEMLRPEWEDRFDVGFAVDGEDYDDSDEPEIRRQPGGLRINREAPAATGQQPSSGGLLGFFKRLFSKDS